MVGREELTMKKIIVPVFFVLFVIIAFLYEWHDLNGFTLKLFYALAAYYFSVFVKDSENPVLAILLTIAWLFFYPNTFYLLTQYAEFSILNDIYGLRLDMIYFLLRMGSILFGALCGVLSMQNIASRFHLNINLRMVLFIGVSFLTSLLLLNFPDGSIDSWGWVSNPLTLRNHFVDFKIDLQNLYFILGYTTLQMMCLMFLDKGD